MRTADQGIENSMNHYRLRLTSRFAKGERWEAMPESTRPKELLLSVVDQSGADIRVVSFFGEMQMFVDWLRCNSLYLLNENPPSALPDGETLAIRLRMFYENVDSNDDDQVDQVFEFRERHGIRFALYGYDVPNIFLGRRGESYEVSISEPDEEWGYDIDLRGFLVETAGASSTED